MDDDDVIGWLFIHSHFCEVKQISSHRISWVKCTLAVHGYAAWDGSPTRHPHSRTHLRVTTGKTSVPAYTRHSTQLQGKQAARGPIRHLNHLD